MVKYSTNIGINIVCLSPIEKGDVINVVDKKGNSITKYVESIKDNRLELENYHVQSVLINY